MVPVRTCPITGEMLYNLPTSQSYDGLQYSSTFVTRDEAHRIMAARRRPTELQHPAGLNAAPIMDESSQRMGMDEDSQHSSQATTLALGGAASQTDSPASADADADSAPSATPNMDAMVGQHATSATPAPPRPSMGATGGQHATSATPAPPSMGATVGQHATSTTPAPPSMGATVGQHAPSTTPASSFTETPRNDASAGGGLALVPAEHSAPAQIDGAPVAPAGTWDPNPRDDMSAPGLSGKC